MSDAVEGTEVQGTEGQEETQAQTQETQETHANDGGQSSDNESIEMSQEQIDKIVEERTRRYRRASKTAVQDFLKELGVEKASDVKAALSAVHQAEEAKKTELEKMQERLQKAESQAQQHAQALTLERQNRLIEREAQKLGFFDVTDALALIDRSGFDDDIKSDDVSDSLSRLLEGKPHLAKSSEPEASPEPQKPQAPDIRASNGNGKVETQALDVSQFLPAALRKK